MSDDNLIRLVKETQALADRAKALKEKILAASLPVTDTLAELNRRIDLISKALKNGKYSDETAESFEAELSKIQNIIKSLEIKEPERSTLEVEPRIDSKIILTTILNSLKNE